MKVTKEERAEAIADLRVMVKPGDTVYTILKHVSQSGMYRVIDLYVYRNNEPCRITWTAAQLLEGYDERHEGAKASGCGMDAGFGLVYDLSMNLYPSYNCQGDGNGNRSDRCPSNEHVNPGPDRDNYNRRRKHRDGYAISHRWQ